MTELDVTLPDGRVLHVYDDGDPGGKVMGKLQAPEVSRFAAPPFALISQMCAEVT